MLWSQQAHLVTHWMTRAAGLMREQQLDTSPAHVIESVRLSNVGRLMGVRRGRLGGRAGFGGTGELAEVFEVNCL